MTAFFLGVRSVCPEATMKVRYTATRYDEEKEQKTAAGLIENEHCVLISQQSDSEGAALACEQAGVPNVSYNGNTYPVAEKTFLMSCGINWTPYFQYAAECVVTGKSIRTDWTGTFADNAVVLSGLNSAVAADGTLPQLTAAIDGFRAGTLHVFAIDRFVVGGETMTEYMADINGDYTPDTNVIRDGYFDESNADECRSAPYFDILIDGVTNLNVEFA